MSTLERAIEIATEAHRGQLDKAGNEYIQHPLRVMAAGRTTSEKIVGVLHDVVEDNNWTLEQLAAEGFSGEIIEAIRTNPRPTNIDGIKRRTRASMGRCQGGFCTPYMVEILAKEMGVDVSEITKSGGESYINLSHTEKGKR